MGQCFNKACALPPLGHGVGVNRVINPVMILIWGHDTWRKRKGTLHTAAHPRFGMALCPSSGKRHEKGNPSGGSDACPRGEVSPLCFCQGPTATSVQRSTEENVSGACGVKEKQLGLQLWLMGSRYLNLRASPSLHRQGDLQVINSFKSFNQVDEVIKSFPSYKLSSFLCCFRAGCPQEEGWPLPKRKVKIGI